MVCRDSEFPRGISCLGLAVFMFVHFPRFSFFFRVQQVVRPCFSGHPLASFAPKGLFSYTVSLVLLFFLYLTNVC